MIQLQYKYKELFTPADGLFSYMDFEFEGENNDTGATANQLDALFYYKYGNKRVTALVTDMVQDGTLQQQAKSTIANLILNIFYNKWDNLRNALFESEYDTTAITEYTETINTSDNKERTNDDTNKTYGFNSSEGVNDSSSITNETNSSTGEKVRTFKGRSGIFPQTVIEAEIKLRQKNLYLDYIMQDVNSIINLKIY